MYIYRKGSIAGPMLKMPFIGPFLQSVNPKFTEYQAKWATGDLSCVSVFHKYVSIHNPSAMTRTNHAVLRFVVIGSTRDVARKIFNSPSFVKPCVVDAAYKLLRPEN